MGFERFWKEVIEVVEQTKVERLLHRDGAEQLKVLYPVFHFIWSTFRCGIVF